MLDFRIATFLKLCETRSYTVTAQMLHITQPSVTQHIKYLQKKYRCTLFTYEGKALRLTPEGEYLRRQAVAMTKTSSKVLEDLHRMTEKRRPLRFGCTKAYGETMVPQVLGKMMNQDEDLEVSFCIENTKTLLEMLEGGKLDFIMVDKNFAKPEFGCVDVTKDVFCAWACPELAETLGNVTLKKLFREKLIVREEGSGSRLLLDRVLDNRNCDIDDFYAHMECNAPSIIRELVASGVGVTFGYASCTESENVVKINVTDLNEKREICFFYLKNNMYPDGFHQFFENFTKCWKETFAK